ncbi:glucokinase [Saonia flava]|uniref:Glucokinase n=1 Tax=Saonia flava TaxID=523696 RepID=A0A846R5W2_9FLAO|nr:ROK family protein [Saonia flava]NJB72169.1 glucokinase [Saonia flava]
MKEEKEYVLGIDIGGTYTKLGLVNRNGDILANSFFDTQAQSSFSIFQKKIEKEISNLKSKLQKEQQLLAIGIGAPNANFNTGKMEHPPNFKWGDYVPITDSINRILDLPLTITNDANAAALGEMHFGMAKGMKDFVVLTLGTGLGSGLVSHGALITGANGMAGELGHVNVFPNGRQCNCGLKGCLETYASVTGIRRTVFELISEMNIESPLKKLSFKELSGQKISEAALNGDVIALKAFEYTGKILGSKMADTAAHLDPEAFILTGGLSNAGKILLDPIISSMEENLFNAYKKKIKVLISSSPSSNAVLGPAALAWQSLDSN